LLGLLKYLGVGRTIAAGFGLGRKVRAPQGRTLGNAQRGRPLESATEKKPPKAYSLVARVKRWGKSPPDAAATPYAGMPRPEQDQIGEAAGPVEASRVGRLRLRETVILEE